MIDRDGLDRGLGVEAIDEAQRNVANGTARTRYHVAHLARARKNGRAAIERGAVHHDGAKGLTRAGRLISVDDLNPQVLATDFFPVGDLAGVNIAELLGREVIDRVIVVHDDRDTVVGNDDGSQAQILFVGIESTGGAGDIGRASADGFDASGRTQTGNEHVDAGLLLKALCRNLGDRKAGRGAGHSNGRGRRSRRTGAQRKRKHSGAQDRYDLSHSITPIAAWRPQVPSSLR